MKRSLLIAALLAAGCATEPYDAPYAILQTDIAPSADAHVIPVLINSVDGTTARLSNREVVRPGPHQVKLDVGPRRGFKTATQHTFELVAAPCTRYYLAARLDTLVGQQWTPIVRSTEPLGECSAKFGGPHR